MIRDGHGDIHMYSQHSGAEAGGPSPVLGYSGLHPKFQASQDYIPRPHKSKINKQIRRWMSK